MRVLILAPASVVHTQRWVEALAERGVKLTLVTQHPASTWQPPAPVQLRTLPFRGAVGYFMNAPAARRVANDVRADLVNVHYASGYGATAALVGYRPTLLSVWGSDVFDFPDQSPLAGRLVRWNLRRMTRIAATSRIMANQVRTLVPGIDEVAITPFGVDGVRFRRIEGLRDQAAITIGTVKTLDDKYGIDLLIRAFARLMVDPMLVAAGTASRLRLLIVGDGPRRAMLENLASNLRVDDVTTFVGQVPHAEVPFWLNRLDVYSAPSRLDSESFGVAVIEASSCAIPVVVSDAGGLPEVVENGVTGFVVRRENVEALSEALRALVLSESRRQAMGDAGRAFVQREFAWSACVDRMINLYESVIDGARSR